MDKEWPLEKRQRLLAVVERHPTLLSIHDLRPRTSGSHDIAQFHIWLDAEHNLLQTHKIMDEIHDSPQGSFPGLELIIHPDPADESGTFSQPDARTLLAQEAETDGKVVAD